MVISFPEGSKVIAGVPDVKHKSTSHVERQNLTMGMHVRRFTRLTNGFSKKVENHAHAVAIHYMTTTILPDSPDPALDASDAGRVVRSRLGIG